MNTRFISERSYTSSSREHAVRGMAITIISFSFLDKEEKLSDIKHVSIYVYVDVYLSYPLSENGVWVLGGGFHGAVL